MAAEVLVVDGDRFFARSIQTQLEGLGVTVAHQLTGAEALDHAYRDHPRLVLVDVELGAGLDGFAMVAAMRGRFDVRVIYMTRSELAPQLLERLLARGAVVLSKPCSTDRLLAALERACGELVTRPGMRGDVAC